MAFKNLKLSKKTTFIVWVVIIAFVIAAPTILPVFRLNLLGRYLSLAIVALGVDLIWGFTGLLSLGQGIFFALGGYCAAMYLQIQVLLNSQTIFQNSLDFMELIIYLSSGNHLDHQYLVYLQSGLYQH